MSDRRPSMTSLFTTTGVSCVDLTKPSLPLYTGIGYLDHMMDQINSHAQIGVGLTVHHHSDFSTLSNHHLPDMDEEDDTNHGDSEDDEDNCEYGDDETPVAASSKDEDEDDEDESPSKKDKKVKKIKKQKKNPFAENPNRLAHCNQASLLRHVGWTLGRQMSLLPKFLGLEDHAMATSRFCCPLDEALVECILTKQPSVIKTSTADEESPNAKKRKLDSDNHASDNTSTTTTTTTKPIGRLVTYKLAPFGKYPPPTGRTQIGHLETAALEEYFKAFAKSSGLEISLIKLRGDNGHHIVESTFKAFSRAMRNLLDGTDTREKRSATSSSSSSSDTPTTTTTTSPNQDKNGKRPLEASDEQQRVEEATFQQAMWGENSANWKESLALKREGSVERSTKETKISVQLKLDGGAEGVNIQTGIKTLDEFFTVLAKEACLSLTIDCTGDLWVDDHHTAEDVAIAVGQVLTQALGTKAGLNRMWCSLQHVGSGGEEEKNVETAGEMMEVTMDLSNRPCLTHNLNLEESHQEKIGDLSVEMLEHVLDSLVVNGHMTVHIVLSKSNKSEKDDSKQSVGCLKDRAMATAAAFGKALKYCAMVDYRRSGQTASSKGTLSV